MPSARYADGDARRPRATHPDSAGPATSAGGLALATPPGAPPGPPRPAGPRRSDGPPPPAKSKRRRAWVLATVAAVAVLLGAGTAVVVNQRGQDERAGGTTQAGEQPGADGGQAQPGEPTATPSGVAGLGPNSTASPTASPSQAGGFTPFAAPRKTLPGASLHLRNGESFADALRRSDSTYGPLRMVRVFYPGLPPNWNGSRAAVANRTVVLSFKAPPREVTAGRHDARLTSFFKSVPKNVDVYWSYFHEPENDVERGAFTPAQFSAAFAHVAALADKAQNPRLRSTLILMCWTLNPNSKRDFNAYYPGASVVDALGWDCYNSAAKNDRYAPPADLFSRMINKSKELGKPWGLAETGSLKIASDSSGAGRAKWLRDVSKYLNEQKPLWVAYYDYKVGGGDYRLTDAPSQQAWKAWCEASPA